MADDANPEVSSQFTTIMDAMEDFSKAASINSMTYASFISQGALSPEMKKKLLSLEEAFDAFRRRITR